MNTEYSSGDPQLANLDISTNCAGEPGDKTETILKCATSTSQKVRLTIIPRMPLLEISANHQTIQMPFLQNCIDIEAACSLHLQNASRMPEPKLQVFH